MAHKRMFSKDITTSDAFREMPSSAQSLYFHLGMEADDDGFLDNYRGLMRSVNASEDDFRVLIGKRFLIPFPSKVVVIKHWLINNSIRKDRYSETKHLEEKRALLVKENGAYTELSNGIPNGNQTATQKRIEEDRIEEDSVAPQSDAEVVDNSTKLVEELIFSFKEMNPSTARLYGMPPQRAAAGRLIETHGLDRTQKAVLYVMEHRDDRFCPSITTPVQLEAKWAQLEDYARKSVGKIKQVII